MRIKTLRNDCWKFITILSAVIVITASLFFVSTGLASAASPPYTNWAEYPTNPVFDPLERVYYPSVLFDGTTYRMWSDNGTSIDYSTSTDGINWAPNTPMIGLVTNAHHPHVEKVGAKYMMWYWNDYGNIYTINAIRTAESTDGVNWTLDQPITQVGSTVVTGTWPNWNTGTYGVCDVFYNAGGSGSITVPTNALTVWANKFVMYYDGTTGRYEDIGVAVSNDGKNWQGYNSGLAPVLAHGPSGWDDTYTTFSTVLNIGGTYYMWYSGGHIESNEGIGYATSSDGLSWTKYTGNPILHKTDPVPWRSVRTYTPMVIYDASQFSGHGEAAYFKMWFSGKDAPGNYAMGYARILEPTATPATVGGRVNPVNKTAILAPYIGFVAGISALFIVSRLALKRFRFARVNSRK
jgi:hypothetical protein